VGTGRAVLRAVETEMLCGRIAVMHSTLRNDRVVGETIRRLFGLSAVIGPIGLPGINVHLSHDGG
jgi:hypothetical protein